MHHRFIIALHAVLILLSLSACMTPKNARIGSEAADRTRAESEQHIVQGDYRSALDVYANAHRKYRNDQTLLANYRKTIESIHHAADEAFRKEDFSTSGRIYHVLLKNHPSYQEVFNDLSFDKALLHARLEDCSSHLSQRALAQYRKGSLAEAISIWKSILAFDPNNAGVVKAIDTATIQLKNLQHSGE